VLAPPSSWLALLATAGAITGCAGVGGADTKSFRLPSPTMSPTFKVGDIVQADLGAYKSDAPERGDIVVLYPPAGSLDERCGVATEPADGHPCEMPTTDEDRTVKVLLRVTGLPGDWLYIKDNRSYIGKARRGPYTKQDEPYVAENPLCDAPCNLPKPVQIPADHYFVMGDNRGESYDSRIWGPVRRSSVLGQVGP